NGLTLSPPANQAVTQLLKNVEVIIRNTVDGANEVLAVDTSVRPGFDFFFTPATPTDPEGILEVFNSNGATAADFQAVLRTLTYDDTAAVPRTDERLITLEADSG